MNNLTKTIRQKLDEIKMVNDNGQECWSARDLLTIFEYEKWDKFQNVIRKAEISLKAASRKSNDHILQTEKMVNLGSGSERPVKDFLLTKYACFLVAQNADPGKKAVAEAQAYFAIQTHKQELFEQLSPDGRRLMIREEVIDNNKKLNSVAKEAGVKRFGAFYDEGYKGLYGMRYKDIVKHKRLGKDKLLDRAGETELAANLFRITQTHDQINNKLESGERVGEPKAMKTHYVVGRKVRKAIEDIGGTMVENLAPEKHIKKLQLSSDKNLLKITV